MLLMETLQCEYVILSLNQIFCYYCDSHSFPFIHLEFKPLSAVGDQGITQQAAVFEEAPAIFSTRTHNCHSKTLKQRLVCARQSGGEADEVFFFFSSLSSGVSSLSIAQNDEP